MTVADALRAATERLGQAGCDTPRLDAEILLAHALGCDRGALVVSARDELRNRAAFEALVARRVAREPVAYITGVREFRWISLAVDRRVLIPRPETELLVEVGLSLPAGARVLDVGTGSGAVALALKHERPDLVLYGVDVSADAIEVARANAARLGLEVRFVHGELLAGLRGSADAVLANLPYVANGACLAPELALYEPAEALFGGADGLDVIRRLVRQLDEVEVVALEVGLGQAPVVGSLLRGAGWGSVEARRDLAGIERLVVGRR